MHGDGPVTDDPSCNGTLDFHQYLLLMCVRTF
jgi:hypothetical protein